MPDSRFDIDEARRAKAARAQCLSDLEEGGIKLVEVLMEPPEALKRTDIWVVLLACRGLGREGARTVCERAAVWPHTWLGKLVKQERRALIKELPERVL